MQEEKRENSLLFQLWKNTSNPDNIKSMESYTDDLEKLESESYEKAEYEDFSVHSGKHSKEDQMSEDGNYLEMIHRQDVLEHSSKTELAYYSDFMLDGEEPDKEKRDFMDALQIMAKRFIQDDISKKGSNSSRINSQVCIKISEDEMEAWMFAFPPKNEGKHVTDELILEALDQSGVFFGINESLIQRIVVKKAYLKLAVVARGAREIDGIEGKVLDRFPRENYMGIDSQNKQDVDFTALKCLHRISAGDVISELVYPIQGLDGSTVTGIPLKAKKVPPIVIPSGSNTKMNEDGTALVSNITGTLYYDHGKFHVKDIVHVLSDVDSFVGNIDTIGNLEIRGDVLGGFTVQATGNIRIHGMVSNSTIIAGGDIKIDMGIKGGGEGILQAGGSIDCSYMESCIAKAKGNIASSSIVNCEVYSDRNVESENVIGGSITALRQIHVGTIGSDQRHQVTFYLGNTKEIRQEKLDIETSINQLGEEIKKLKKDIRFLKNKANPIQEDEENYFQLQNKYEERKEVLTQKKKRLNEIKEGLGDYSECELTARMLYPPVTVCIASDSYLVSRVENMCRIWSEDGEIRMS